ERKKGHKKNRSDNFAKQSARIIEKWGNISPKKKKQKDKEIRGGVEDAGGGNLLQASVVPDLVKGEVYKRNYRFGYKKRFLIIDLSTGSFAYYTSSPLPDLSDAAISSGALFNWTHFPSGATRKLCLKPGQWTLSNAADDDSGFFIIKGNTETASTLSGRINSIFFKCITTDAVDSIRTSSTRRSSKSKYLLASERLTCRGADIFLSHYTVKGFAKPGEHKRFRKGGAGAGGGGKDAGREIQRTISDITFDAAGSSERSIATFDKAGLEHRVKPVKYYPDAWMMHSELMSEVVLPTDHLVDLTSRSGLGSATAAKRIGLVKVELLGAYGLPKLDRFGKTDLYAIMIVGSNVFRTDTIDDNYSPVFLPRTKRGAVFPIYVPYEQLYVGGFDDDGDFLSDDFVGRVSVDLSRLKPHVSYDVTLKMRESDTMYSRKARGAIRLRIEITEYVEPRLALKSFVKNFASRPKEAEGIMAHDRTSARALSLVLWGTEPPGEYSPPLFKATLRESDLYEVNTLCLMKKTLWELAFYENEGFFGNLKSLYVLSSLFLTIDHGPRAFFTAVPLFYAIILIENYWVYGRDPVAFSQPPPGGLDLKRPNNEFPFVNRETFPSMEFSDSLARKVKRDGIVNAIEGGLGIDKDDDSQQEYVDDDDDYNDMFSVASAAPVKAPVDEERRSTFTKTPKYIEQDCNKATVSSSIALKFAKYEKRAKLATLGLVHDVIASYPDEGKEASASNTKKKKKKKRLTLRAEPVNPVLKLKRTYLGPVQRGFKNIVTTCRAVHHILVWRTFGTSLLALGFLFVVALAALVFPTG
ncbi:hypothetical protein TrRE_jg12267, partial [Triparma retinervis]